MRFFLARKPRHGSRDALFLTRKARHGRRDALFLTRKVRHGPRGAKLALQFKHYIRQLMVSLSTSLLHALFFGAFLQKGNPNNNATKAQPQPNLVFLATNVHFDFARLSS